jgi:hypothetical protein
MRAIGKSATFRPVPKGFMPKRGTAMKVPNESAKVDAGYPHNGH